MRKINHNIMVAVCVLVTTLAGQTAEGKMIIVANDGGPADYTSIQPAIDYAVNDDEIVVRAGTYREAIDFIGKAVRLYSTNGPDVTIIDANGIAGAYHVVRCIGGEGPNTILEGFTLTGGDANGVLFFDKYGAGMYNYQSDPTVINCTFSGNDANNGGGMYNLESSPTVTNQLHVQRQHCNGGRRRDVQLSERSDSDKLHVQRQ
jgi:pectin methylesterase-like acyl-CoA thioesterase